MEINQYAFDAAFNNGLVKYPDDCRRIQHVGALLGLRMTSHQAEEVWNRYSGVRDAQWLNIGEFSYEEIKEAIQEFINARLNSAEWYPE